MSSCVDYLLYHSASVGNILPITSACNVQCVFCSHHSNPEEIVTYKIPPVPLEKLADIVEYLDSDKKIVIGESVTRIDEGEPFTHPDFFAILDLIREKYPQTPIQITTNGTLLTAPIVKRLTDYQPMSTLI